MDNAGCLWFDGGTYPSNPGHGGCGAILKIGEREFSFNKYLGENITNNQAEYNGLLLGLSEAKKRGVKHLLVLGDSQLIIKQMLNEYKCSSKKLISLHQEVQKLALNFETTNFKWIKREKNSDADLQAIKAIKLALEKNKKPTSSQKKPDFIAPPKNVTIHLTEDQENALAGLKSFVNGNKSFFKLSGFAGTGKSFLICYFLKWLELEKLKFVCGSPTNKAAKNLRNLAAAQSVNVEVKTVAQLLGQQPEVDSETGEEIFVAGVNEPQFDRYDIIIIDEFSMINKENFENIVNEANQSTARVIFSGDKAQLPPVKEKEPIVATSPLIDASCNLSKIVRYDGEIVSVAEEIRSNPKYNRMVYPFQTTSDLTIICQNIREWGATAKQYFCSEEFKSNPDYVRVLVWRNKTAASWNNFVRQCLWGEDVPIHPVKGDRLIASKPIFRKNPGGKGKNKFRIVMNNSEECTVVDDVKLKYIQLFKQSYEYWSVPIVTDNGFRQDLLWLKPESEQIRGEKVKYFAQKKQWSSYFDLARNFDTVTYNYALTTHKAQGSSIENVFLDVADMRYCQDLQKILYTGLTRAVKTVFVNQ